MPRALILCEEEFQNRRRRFDEGSAPSPLPYGINALERHGYRLHGQARTQRHVLSKLRDVVEHRRGYPVEQALRAIPSAASADLVIALLEHQGVLAGLWKARGLPPYASRPLVIWSCWLADDVRRAGAQQRAQLRSRFAHADLITHMSRHETEILVDLGLDQSQLATLDFGIDHRYYTPTEVERDIEVLSVGQDRGRDFATLIEAARGTDLRLDIVCNPGNVAGLDIPANVTIHSPVSLSAYRDLLRRAQIVAVPTHDLAYPTGQSVALEASSVGACVAVTHTPAMADYFTDATARLIPLADAEAWRSALLDLRADEATRERLGQAARAAVLDRFNADRMWAQFAGILSDRGIA